MLVCYAASFVVDFTPNNRGLCELFGKRSGHFVMSNQTVSPATPAEPGVIDSKIIWIFSPESSFIN